MVTALLITLAALVLIATVMLVKTESMSKKLVKVYQEKNNIRRINKNNIP